MSAAKTPPASRAAPGPESHGLHLDLVPVDPHRVFAHWDLPPAEFARLQELAAPDPSEAHLTLRVFRLPEGQSNLLNASHVQDFPASATRHAGFYSVQEPGGSVAAVLGIKNAQNRFTPALRSVHVALPEAPRSWTPPPADPAPPRVPQKPAGVRPPPAALPATREKIPDSAALDEATVLAAANQLRTLPSELRTLPGKAAATKLFPETRAAPPGPPETPALDERAVVAITLRSLLANAIDKLAPLVGAATRETLSSTADDAPGTRLASMIDRSSSAAPIRLHATLIVSGRVAPGQRLRVGDRELPIQPGGEFSYQQKLDTFHAVWPLLWQTLAQSSAATPPSLELLGRMPDQAAQLSLHASVEIEGELADPTYRAHLPPEVGVDAAGRFRVVRALPAGALFVPHLVLLSAGRNR